MQQLHTKLCHYKYIELVTVLVHRTQFYLFFVPIFVLLSPVGQDLSRLASFLWGCRQTTRECTSWLRVSIPRFVFCPNICTSSVVGQDLSRLVPFLRDCRQTTRAMHVVITNINPWDNLCTSSSLNYLYDCVMLIIVNEVWSFG